MEKEKIIDSDTRTIESLKIKIKDQENDKILLQNEQAEKIKSI